MGKIEYAFALVDKANILAEMESTEKYQKAIEYQEEAIGTPYIMQIYSSLRTTPNLKKLQNSTQLSVNISKRSATLRSP